MADATQKGRFLEIDTPAKDALLISSFTATESVSGLFHIDVELVAEPKKSSKVKIDDLIGKPMSIQLALGKDHKSPYRHFHGICNRFSQGGRDERFVHYHAELVPWTWLLTQTSDCRIFNDKNVPEIVEQVFNDLKNGFPFVEFQNKTKGGNYTKIDYLVQYRETDFNFISRLLEQEGVHYYFEHQKDKHVLVLADEPDAHKDCPHQAKVRYEPEGGADERDKFVVTSWRLEKEMRPGEYVVRDYQFQDPSNDLEVKSPGEKKVGGNDKLQMFDYLGEYAQRFNKPDERIGDVKKEGEKLVKWRMQEEESPHLDTSGASSNPAFTAGHKFELEKHFDGEQNRKHLLTSVRHSAVQSPEYFSEALVGNPYQNSFACFPDDVKFRPPRTTPKPVVEGVQSAVVVGDKGKEIQTDKYGRVKVKFHWDRGEHKPDGSHEEQKHGENSCWVRVAQVWAGKRWGASFWPRIGQEVVVGFMEGDPDQPIIVGSVYNKEQMPPYKGDGPDSDHKDDHNISGIKTNTTEGGKGYNELRFDDTKDKQQIFIHAEKDMDVRVKNDRREHVVANEHLIRGTEDNDKGDYTELTHGNKQIVTKKHQLEHIEGSYGLMIGNGDADDPGIFDFVIEKQERKQVGPDGLHLTVDGDVNEKVGGKFSQTVTGDHHSKSANYALETPMGDVHIKGGMNVVIEAGMQLTLKVGGNFVSITQAGVDIQGIMTNINSGGSAGSGSGSSPTEPETAAEAAPDEPDKADHSKTGDKSCD